MGYSRKKKKKTGRGGLRIWNFQGYWREIASVISWGYLKTMWTFQGWPRKNDVEFPQVFPEVNKVYKTKISGVFKKVCPQPIWFFFWNWPMSYTSTTSTQVYISMSIDWYASTSVQFLAKSQKYCLFNFPEFHMSVWTPNLLWKLRLGE